MSGVVPFAYSADGQFYACGDGPELFAYSGGEDQPLWKQFCNGMIVGLGTSPGCVHCLDDSGAYTVWDVRSGDSVLTADLGEIPHGLAVGGPGAAVGITARGAVILGTDGSTRPVALPNVTAVGMTPDGSRFLLGTRGGELYLFDWGSGGQIAATAIGVSVTDITWAGREWVVAAGNRLWFVAGEVQPMPAAQGQPAPSPVRKTIDVAGTPRVVTSNSDGVLVACDDSQNNVLVYETHTYKLGGMVKFNRTLGDLAFGPGTSLGIGLEYADANRLEVLSGTLTRSKAGLGKGNTPWYPRMELDQFILRGSVAAKRAGGGPIANIQQVEQGGSSRMFLYIGIALFFGFVCCGGLTSAMLAWRFAF